MIRQAEIRHGIDLSTAIMIGDSAKDIQCGQNAGCYATVLVRTGNGAETEKFLTAKKIFPSVVAQDLKDAAHMILSGRLIPKNVKLF